MIKTKIDTTEVKEKLKSVLSKSMPDKADALISKDIIKNVISILEYLEEYEKEQIEENKKCFREFDSINFACCICENRNTCKEEETKKKKP